MKRRLPGGLPWPAEETVNEKSSDIMSKLNSTKSLLYSDDRLAGGMGAWAAKQSNVQSLRRAVMANLLWEDIAYMDGQSVSDEICRLIPLCAPEEVYNIALKARKEQKLRHTPLFIAVEMCKYDEHRKYVRQLLPQIITRADMLSDFMALYWHEGKKPLCKQAQFGLADAFYNFDEYQFAKYDRDAPIKLRDVMFICHPKPRNEEETALYKRIAERKLQTPDTWEVALSSGKDKKEAWTRLITENKLGAWATLRNLRNMKQVEVDRHVIDHAISSIRSHMLLPFDFIKAVREAPEFEHQIELAMLESYKQLPQLQGNTLMIVDVSGSMNANLSTRSTFTRLDAACAMAILAINQCEDFELVATAGNDSTRVCSSEHIRYPKYGFDLIKQIKESEDRLGGGGIFTRQCLEWCKKQFADKKFDRIIIFSDSQDCDFPDKRTPKPFGERNYICDVSAHTKGINYKGIWTAEISGFSEYFLNYISVAEGNTNNYEH